MKIMILNKYKLININVINLLINFKKNFSNLFQFLQIILLHFNQK